MHKPTVHPAHPPRSNAAAEALLRSPIVPAGYGGRIIFVGASTGGTEAIKVLLEGISARCPPILIVQHMPETFTASFAKRLDGLCAARVVEAVEGDGVVAGTVYIAPGHSHMEIRKAGSGYVIGLVRSPPVNRHRPSVDVLFRSAANVIGRNATGVLLTGMGKDGAPGLLMMKHAGAKTFAQDEHSSVVFGMPREAIELGAADEVLPLGKMASRVMAG